MGQLYNSTNEVFFFLLMTAISVLTAVFLLVLRRTLGKLGLV